MAAAAARRRCSTAAATTHPKVALSDGEVAARIRGIYAEVAPRSYDYHAYADLAGKRRAVRGLLRYNQRAGAESFAEAVNMFAALSMPKRVEDVLAIARERGVRATPAMQKQLIVAYARSKDIRKATALLRRYLHRRPAGGDGELPSLLLWLQVQEPRRWDRDPARGAAPGPARPTADYLNLAALLGVGLSRFAAADCLAEASDTPEEVDAWAARCVPPAEAPRAALHGRIRVSLRSRDFVTTIQGLDSHAADPDDAARVALTAGALRAAATHAPPSVFVRTAIRAAGAGGDPEADGALVAALTSGAAPPQAAMLGLALQGEVAAAAAVYEAWRRQGQVTLAMVEGMVQVYGAQGDFAAADAIYKARPFTKITRQMLWKLLEAAVVACLFHARDPAAAERARRLFRKHSINAPTAAAAAVTHAVYLRRNTAQTWEQLTWSYRDLAMLPGSTVRRYAMAVCLEHRDTGDAAVLARLEDMFYELVGAVRTAGAAVALSEPLITALLGAERDAAALAVLRDAAAAAEASTVQYLSPHLPILHLAQQRTAVDRVDCLLAVQDITLALSLPPPAAVAPVLAAPDVFLAYLEACTAHGDAAAAATAVALAVDRGGDVLRDLPLLLSALTT